MNRWSALVACVLIVCATWTATARSDGPTEAEQIADLQARFACLAVNNTDLSIHWVNLRLYHPAPAGTLPHTLAFLNQWPEDGNKGALSRDMNRVIVDPGCFASPPHTT